MDIPYQTVADGELFKFNEIGKVIEGVLLKHRVQNTAKGVGQVYEVRTKEGVVTFFAPSLLHQKLESIKLGSVVRIKFEKETKTNSGNTVKIFKVDHAPATDAILNALGIQLLHEDGDEAAADAAMKAM